MEFYNQWSNRPPHAPQEFTEPTCTVPNQAMSVQEIIAKYSRTGLVPQSYLKKDSGGNVATDPDFDPLDDAMDVMEAAEAARQAAAEAAAHGSADGGPSPSGEPEQKSAPAGEGE